MLTIEEYSLYIDGVVPSDFEQLKRLATVQLNAYLCYGLVGVAFDTLPICIQDIYKQALAYQVAYIDHQGGIVALNSEEYATESLGNYSVSKHKQDTGEIIKLATTTKILLPQLMAYVRGCWRAPD